MNDQVVRYGTLPNLVIIGAMKCGTSALHAHLDRHPEIAMSQPKELNFFIGRRHHHGRRACQQRWSDGNWTRGRQWYVNHFRADAAVRGESSPGYTSPDHPQVAQRMAVTIPDTRLLYLVRDPVARALSQYRHHRADGTERRPLEEALLDPASQYLSRGRYYERLLPFVAHYPRDRIMVVAQEDLRERAVVTLRRVFQFVEVDDTYRCEAYDRSATSRTTPLDGTLRARLAATFRADAQRLRAFADQPFPTWSV